MERGFMRAVAAQERILTGMVTPLLAGRRKRPTCRTRPRALASTRAPRPTFPLAAETRFLHAGHS